MRILLATALLLLTACATTYITPRPSGGSKAGATVELTFEQNETVRDPVIDWDTADLAAKERCAAWGYLNADRFGGQTRYCIYINPYGCATWQVTVTYQCTE